MSRFSRWRKTVVRIAVFATVAAGCVAIGTHLQRVREIVKQIRAGDAHQPPAGDFARLVERVDQQPATLRLTSDDSARVLGLRFDEARPALGAEPLRLPGSLFLDPNRLIHVHSRFNGETVALGETVGGNGHKRLLQYGDRVTKGQVLAVIWSKEVGEKKSELVDAISKLSVSRHQLGLLESLTKGVVPERNIFEARRAVEADSIAVAKAERTLRSWRISDEEIESVHREVQTIQERKSLSDQQFERHWAETEIRAAIDGIIVEKNFNVGDIIDPNDELFKIADLSRLLVLANVYEEDLWAIRALPPDERRWHIDLKSDPADNQIEGTFELIGSVIDPAQRTGTVMGWLDNSRGHLAVGQFITATIQLPQNPSIVAMPESALIEEGDSTTVFVETDAARREFTRRKIKVVRRSAGIVYIDSSTEGVGSPSIRAGDRVVVAGALGLGGELANLLASAPKRN